MPEIVATQVASGLDQPLYATAPPGDTGRLFIVEKGGDIKILDLATGSVLGEPFLDLSPAISTGSEQGLLGLAFDPNYASNGRFYVNYTNVIGDTEVRSFTVSADNPHQADAGSGQPLLFLDQPFDNHNGGWLGFGLDGYLYIATGDGGSKGDPLDNAQNLDSLLGKILRIDVSADAFPEDAGRNYAIPADNPFVGTAGADEVWAYGLRHPWRASFDRASGTMFIGDVGQSEWEEVDIGVPGGNYGWNVFEGPELYSIGDTLTGGSAIAPVAVYDHGAGVSIIGGYVYRGPSAALQGLYFYADFGSGSVWTLHHDGTQWVSTDVTSDIVTNTGTIDWPSSFGEDAVGNLYILDLDGEAYRLSAVDTAIGALAQEVSPGACFMPASDFIF